MKSTSFKEMTGMAGRTALIGFSLFFLVCMVRGIGVAGSCLRAAAVALALYLSVRIISHLFFRALVNDLTDFMHKESMTRKTEADT
jgi:hypothetical protein